MKITILLALSLFCAVAALLPSQSEYALLQNILCQVGVMGWAYSAGKCA